MKKSILFLFIVLSASIYGQKYVPFPTDNASWHIKYKHQSDNLTPTRTLLMLNYSMHGDTVINSILYKKIYGGLDINKIKGAIREEDKRIYYLDFTDRSGYLSLVKPLSPDIKECVSHQKANSEGEFLLYDFNNKKIGDMLFNSRYGTTITNIDSILVGQTYRKRYEYGSWQYGKDYAIEGIGSVKTGLFDAISDIPLCGGIFGWEFVCFSQNNESIYQNPDYKSCNSTEKWSDNDYLKTGTEWYFGETSRMSSSNPDLKSISYNALKSTGDTIINGQKCFIISRIKGNPSCYTGNEPFYLKQSNDTVSFYNKVKNKFCTLYVYGAHQGESWTVEFPSGDILTTVDSVTIDYFFNNVIQILHVTYKDKNNMTLLKSRIIENMGDINNLYLSGLPTLNVCDGFLVQQDGLRCYVHPDYGTYKTGTLSCEYVTSVLQPDAVIIKVYQASTGDVEVETGGLSGSCTFELYDGRGTLLRQAGIDENNHSVSIATLSSGLYIYRVFTKSGVLKTGKLVKN